MRPLALFFGGSILLLASEAHSDPLHYSALPLGAITEPPTRGIPTSIPAKEGIADFRVERVRQGESDSFINVLRTTQRGLCLSYIHGPHLRDREKAPKEWSTSAIDQLWISMAPNRSYDVAAVHGERLARAPNGNVSLEIVDAFYDVRTGGSRLIGRKSVSLARVASSRSVDVYAMRDSRGDGEERVHFVIDRASPPVPPVESFSLEDSRSVVDAPPNMSCTPGRFMFDARRNEGGTALVAAEITIDPVEKKSRPLGIAFGVSRLSRDPEPVLSVSFGWLTR